MLAAELKEIDAALEKLTSQSAPRLRGQFGVGPQTAAVLIAVAGDNLELLHSETVPAALCCASPLQAEALKLLGGIGSSLAGRLLLLDAREMQWSAIGIARNPQCGVCGG